MKNKIKVHPINIIVLTVFILIVLFTILLFPFSKTEDTVFESKYTGEKIESWTIDGKKVSYPYTLNQKQAKVIRQTTTLPKKIGDDDAIMFLSNYCKIRVYIKDKLIYSYGTVKQLPFGRMLGNIHIIVPLEKSYQGKELTIEEEQVYNLDKLLTFKSYTLPDVYIGDKSALKFGIFHDEIWRFVVIILIIIIALISFAFAIYIILVEGNHHSNMYEFLNFGTMCLCIAGWTLGDSSLMQFISSSNEANSFLIFISLSLLSLPYLGYCLQILSKGKKVFKWMRLIGLPLPLINTLAFVFNIFDPFELQIFSQVFIVSSAFVSLFFAILDWNNGPYSKLLILDLVLTVVALSSGLILYCMPNSAEKGIYSLFMGIGFMCFVFILLIMSIAREIPYIRERLAVNIYKEMAYIDKLTKCKNRACYDKEIDEGIKDAKNQTITMLLIDLNHLKQINDKYGHDAGDELIKGCGTCLIETFDTFGNSYRLGGDEFAVIVWNAEHEIEYYLEQLSKNVEKYNESHTYRISMAKGYSKLDCHTNPNVANSIYKEADHNMYIDKERCHKELQDEVIINPSVSPSI